MAFNSGWQPKRWKIAVPMKPMDVTSTVVPSEQTIGYVVGDKQTIKMQLSYDMFLEVECVITPLYSDMHDIPKFYAMIREAHDTGMPLPVELNILSVTLIQDDPKFGHYPDYGNKYKGWNK